MSPNQNQCKNSLKKVDEYHREAEKHNKVAKKINVSAIEQENKANERNDDARTKDQ